MVRWLMRDWVCLAAVLLTGVIHSFAAEGHWIHLQSESFNLYTDLSGVQAADLLGRLETAQRNLAQLSVDATSIALPVRVVAFRSQDEFAPYRTSPAATAFFLHSEFRDYVVLGGSKSGESAPALHEFAHYVVHQRFHELPLWMDEGLADLYSTVDRKEGVIRLGLPVEDRLEWLENDGLAYDLPTLFRMDPNTLSALHHDTPRSRFYAESWLLVHMLRLSTRYAAGFNNLLDLLERGVPAEDCLKRIYGRSTADVQRDLKGYLKAGWMRSIVSLPDESSRAGLITLQPVEDTTARAVLADLFAAEGRFEMADTLLSNMAKTNVAVAEAMAYYSLRQNKIQEAQVYLRQAIAGGTRDARVFYDSARISLANGEDISDATQRLNKALQLCPGLSEARDLLNRIGQRSLERMNHRSGE